MEDAKFLLDYFDMQLTATDSSDYSDSDIGFLSDLAFSDTENPTPLQENSPNESKKNKEKNN